MTLWTVTAEGHVIGTFTKSEALKIMRELRVLRPIMTEQK